VRFGARFEDVERAGEEERELEGCADWCVGGGGGEDGYVEGVILWALACWIVGEGEKGKRERGVGGGRGCREWYVFADYA